MTATATSTAPQAPATEPVIIQADPKSLLLEGNVRSQVALDPEFVASIAEHGVLVPIVAVRTAEDRLRVRYGQRRTLGAIKAACQLVTVVVIGDEDTATDAVTATRIVQQFHENEHRAGLGVTDQIGAVSQLAAFGLDADVIAARLGAPKQGVDKALAVAKSKLASKAAPRYDLTLDQAATIADFEDAPDTVKALVIAAKDGTFDHVAQRARDDRKAAEVKAALTEKLEKSGVSIVEQPSYNERKVAYIDRLKTPEGKDITVAGHKKCPGHAACLVEPDWRKDEHHIEYVCTDWKANGHRDRYGVQNVPAEQKTEKERTAAAAERRTVIDNNKAWVSAETVRRQWLKTFLARKSAPKGTVGYLAGELARGSYYLGQALSVGGDELLRETLGHNSCTELAEQIAKATDGRAQVLALAVVLCGCEASTDRQTWRSHREEVQRYFAFLAANGYTLSDVEQLVMPKPTRARRAAAEQAVDEPSAVDVA